MAGYSYAAGSTVPRGFIRATGGTFARVLSPNGFPAQLIGINDRGDVIGEIPNSNAFLRSAGGEFTALTTPLAPATSIKARGLNNDGFIVGSYVPANGLQRAYLRNLAGTFQTLGEIFSGRVEASAISSSGRILLTRPDSSPKFHFSNAAGNFPNFDLFIPGYTKEQIFLRGVNANNIAVGEVEGRGILVRADNGADYVLFDLPGASTTAPYAINDRNEIAGSMRDADFGLNGFIADFCTPNLAQASGTHGSGAELNEFAVTASGVCLWAAESTVPWITLKKSLGAGAGQVRYQLAANTGAERQGPIRVGTQEFVVTQAAGSCTYSVSQLSQFPTLPAGGPVSILISTGAQCPWTAMATDPWVQLSQTSGTGAATVIATVAAAPPASFQRSTQVSVAGTQIQITQLSSACTLTLNRTETTTPAEGGLEGFRVTAPQGCGWSVNSPANWIFVNTGYGTGNGEFTLRIDRNLSSVERSVSLSVVSTGQTAQVNIRQSGGPTCGVSLVSDYRVVDGAGQSLYLGANFGTNCGITITSDVPWITIRDANTPNASGQVAPNPSRLPRRGTIRAGTATLTVDQFGNVYSQLGYVPITPCRLLDTRPGEAHPDGPPAIQRFAGRTVSVSGRCGVPATARAYALAVTARPKVSLAYLTLRTAGVGGTSTLNSWDGRTVSNLSVVAASQSSFTPYITISVTDETDATLDVVGYFADPVADSLVFYPLAPCRVVDTRIGEQPLVAGTPRTVAMAGRCGVPATAAVVSLNVTSVPSGGQVDWLTVWPGGRPRTITPAVNEARTPTASAMLVPVGADGTVQMQASQGSDAVLDVNGYFAPPSDQGLYFTVLNDTCRMADTRVVPFAPSLAPGVARTIDPRLAGCPIAAEARAYALNATAVPAGPLAFLSLFPAPTWQGNSTLNAFTGQVTANFAIVPDTGLGIGALASGVSDVVLDSLGYFVAVPASMRRPALIDSFTLPPR
ncbi:MAG: BACON domain-containing protein [Bryobacterales bacterium]|nr:BACON domain-containing protein [Bryobacterales bacterium]